jgi:hypothetical protein
LTGGAGAVRLAPYSDRRGVSTLVRQILGNFELGLKFAAIAAALVGIRWVLWELGVEGMATDAVSAGIR